jgi:AcrR family transcriptional regulator
MVRARDEHADTDVAGSRPGGRPRDATIDEAIIVATRDRLVRDGYSQMTIGDIAADANVSRPTLYRRWSTKFELVVDALDYGFRKEHGMHTLDLSRMEPREALVEAVRRLDPAYYNPNAIVLMSNFAGEAVRTPELLEIVLQERGAVRDEIDKHTIATLCFGSYHAAFYRGESVEHIAEAVVAVLWPGIAKTTGTSRSTGTAERAATL